MNLCHFSSPCFLPHVPPTSRAGIRSWINVLPSHHLTLEFILLDIFFLPFPSHTLLSPDWFICSAPTPPFSLKWIRVWLHHKKKKKICHFIFQYNQERMCPAPACPFGGDLAMFHKFNCANRVGKSQRQWDRAIIKLKWFIYFSFRQNLYFLAYYWQFSFQNPVLWSLNFFFSNYQWLLKRTVQTVTLLGKFRDSV